MRIGLFTSETGDLDQLAEQAAQAERDGFDGIWFSQIFGGDALTIIALAAQRTERIEFGTSVIPIQTRHPYSFAQQAGTVQAATGGRLTLGIGLSHQPVVEAMWGLSYDKPARHMREYLQVFRPLLNEGRVAFTGEVFNVRANLQLPKAPPLSVCIAALSPVMLRIAGELADGTITWMTGAKTIASHTAPRLTAAAKAAGRPAPRVCVALPIAVTDEPAVARAQAAQFFQVYGQLPNYKRMLDREGASGPSDVAIVGNESEVEQQLRALAAAGATDFLASAFPAGDDAPKSLARTRDLLKGLVGKV